MRYNRGFIKNCNSIRSNNTDTGSGAEPQLLEAKGDLVLQRYIQHFSYKNNAILASAEK